MCSVSANVVLLLSSWMWSYPLKTSQTRSLIWRKTDLLAPFNIRKFKTPTSVASVKSHSQEHFPNLSLVLKWTAGSRRRDNQDKWARGKGRIWEFSCSQTKINSCFRNALGPLNYYTSESYQTCIERSKTQAAWCLLWSPQERQTWNRTGTVF